MELDRYFSSEELRPLREIGEDGGHSVSWDDPIVKRYRELGLVCLTRGIPRLTAFGRHALNNACQGTTIGVETDLGTGTTRPPFEPFRFPG